MSGVHKLKDISKAVKRLLEKEVELRDDDNALVSTIWAIEMPESHHRTCLDFLWAYAKGEVTTADTITRARRLIQQDHPELRGKNYDKRKHDASTISKEIK